MTKPTKTLLRVLSGERVDPPPVWLMRQAGRYLPEYRATRAEAGDFLSLCYNPKLAAEVTFQPIRRYGFDAAILFSDILVVPFAMGQKLWFEEGEGPRLAPPLEGNTLPPRETGATVIERLAPIFETVRLLRAGLPEPVTLIGFAGAPWTIATYVLAGRGSKDQAVARLFAYREPARFRALLQDIAAVTADYLVGQIDAGAETVMLFDSWAGSLTPAQADQWVLEPNAWIVKELNARRPGVPVIGFPRGMGHRVGDFARATGVNAVSVEESADLAAAAAQLPAGVAVQGNVDPLALVAGGAALEAAVDACLSAAGDRPHIFNLGHGITPQVPPDHVAQLLARLRNTR
jgi:uroporphyrinogen decarboxylase